MLVGAAYLLDNFGVFDYTTIRWYLFTWETLFILIGTALLITGKRAGIVFILIGAVFLLPDLLDIPRWYPRDIWPIALVGLGLYFILRGKVEKKDEPRIGPDDDYIDELSVFGGIKRVVTAKNFRGGKSTAIFGGSEFDFRNAQLDNEGATIDVFAMFGGSTFIVPANWEVRIEVFTIFGGFSDSRVLINEEAEDGRNVLVLKGFVMFGGGELKSV